MRIDYQHLQESGASPEQLYLAAKNGDPRVSVLLVLLRGLAGMTLSDVQEAAVLAESQREAAERDYPPGLSDWLAEDDDR